MSDSEKSRNSKLANASPRLSGIHLKSAIPGRERWIVEPLAGDPKLALTIETSLQRQPGVLSVKANPLTRSVLLILDSRSGVSHDLIAEWLQRSLSRSQAKLAGPVRPQPSTALPARTLPTAAYWVIAGGILAVPRLVFGVANPVLLGASFVGAAAVMILGVLRYIRSSVLEQRETAGALNRFLEYVRPYRHEFLLAAASSIIRKIVDYAPPIFIGAAVNIVANRPIALFAAIGITSLSSQIIVLGITAWVVYLAESYSEYSYKARWRMLAQKVQHRIRMDAYEHTQLLQLRYLEDNSTGNLTSILNDNINQLQLFLDDGFNSILEIATNVVVIVVLFAVLAPQVAWIGLTPIPFVGWLAVRYHKRTGPIYREVQEQAGAINRLLVNNLSGVTTIRSFGTEGHELERLRALSEDYVATNQGAIILFAAFEPTVRLPIQTAFASLIISGGRSVLNGSISGGAFASILFLLPRFLFPFAYFGQTIDRYQRAMSAVRRIFRLMDSPIGPPGGNLALPAAAVRGDIAFENVYFSYREGMPVLRNFNLTIKGGQTVGIVGATGSGKTTVIKLLLHFYDPSKGSITIDEHDIRHLRSRDLRRVIGFVSQDVFLFDGTIRENIAYGTPDSNFADIVNAAHLAEATGFIGKLPEKYDTIIGERGLKLSGGQRQRISLARALVKNPPILILDEATSSLDNETEAAIQRSLAHITQDRTTIVIAHRLSTIRNADSIIVIGRDGRVIETGRHEELVSNEGFYSALWKVQTGEALSSDQIGNHN